MYLVFTRMPDENEHVPLVEFMYLVFTIQYNDTLLILKKEIQLSAFDKYYLLYSNQIPNSFTRLIRIKT